MKKGIMVMYPARGTTEAKQMAWTTHYIRWVKLLDSHPDISMEFGGLSDKENFAFLHDYDFVYLYLFTISKPETDKHPYWWYEIPRAIKPYCKKLILEFDYEGFMPTLPPFIEKMINCNVDALGYHSHIVNDWNIDVPVYPLFIKQPIEELEQQFIPLPRKQREKSIGIILHAGTGCGIKWSTALCSRLPYKVNVFTSWLGMSEEGLRNACSAYNTNWKFYPHMHYENYMDILRTCYVVLEDNENYYGLSRIAYECAALRIPVVGSTNIFSCLLAYPYTTTNPQNVQLQTQLIKRLFTEKAFYDKVTDYAYKKMKEYLSDEQCLQRFVRILKDLKIL